MIPFSFAFCLRRLWLVLLHWASRRDYQQPTTCLMRGSHHGDSSRHCQTIFFIFLFWDFALPTFPDKWIPPDLGSVHVRPISEIRAPVMPLHTKGLSDFDGEAKKPPHALQRFHGTPFDESHGQDDSGGAVFYSRLGIIEDFEKQIHGSLTQHIDRLVHGG